MSKVDPDEMAKLDAGVYIGGMVAVLVGIVIYHLVPLGSVWTTIIACIAGLVTAAITIPICWAIIDKIELNAALKKMIRPDPQDQYTIQLSPDMSAKEYWRVVDWARPVKQVPLDYVTLLDFDGNAWPSDLLINNLEGVPLVICRPFAVEKYVKALKLIGCDISCGNGKWKIEKPDGSIHVCEDNYVEGEQLNEEVAELRKTWEMCRKN